jgi:hypothetical protein
MRRKALLALLLATCLALPAFAQQVRILVQSSPLAGFQYYGGRILWDEMREGDHLALIREPYNRHDPFAVRVEWRSEKLGYLPRAENREVAAEMDKGTPVGGRIGKLSTDPNPWKRLRVDVYIGL